MATDPDVELVQRAYDALFADDVPVFLGYWVDDPLVEYPAAGLLPYGGRWHGRDGLLSFIERHDEVEDIVEFEPEAFIGTSPRVFVQGRFKGRSKVTDRTWETRWVHVFVVAEGRLASWTAYFDTAAAVDAHRVRGDGSGGPAA